MHSETLRDMTKTYSRAAMLLQKSESLLELSVKQLVIQSRVASSVFLSQDMFGVRKTKFKSFCSKVRYFRIQQELSKPKSNLISFKM